MSIYYLYLAGVLFSSWIGLLLAPYMSGGISSVISNGAAALNHPLDITICSDSPRAVAIVNLIYLLTVIIITTDKHNFRRGEEHGSAFWENAGNLKAKYTDKNVLNNIILTQNVSLSLNVRQHMRNLNVLVCGGSGAGKTRFYAKPNIISANCSMVILDPNG